MKIKTVTIGIPAYNEDRNIVRLISSVLNQKTFNYKITKIIVSSDGSSDNTVLSIKNMKNKMIEIYDNKDRKGIARGLNQIIENSTSDILVTLDADIIVKDKDFIQNLVNPIIKDNIDHTSSAILDIDNKTYFSQILSNSMKLKEILFDSINGGDNVYNCHGLARGYSRKFYKGISFPSSIGNDIYTYLVSVKNGYSFRYVKNAIAYYVLPSNLNDHFKQSSRFFSSGLIIENYFDADFLKKEIRISALDYLKAFLISMPILLKNPIKSLTYFLIQLSVYLKVLVKITNKQAWDLAYSTK